MPLPNSLFSTAFKKNRLGLVTMAVIAAMVYLASLSLAAESSLGTMVSAWGQDLGTRMTVEIPAQEEDDATKKADRIRSVMAALMEMPDIALATLVPESETARLLKPWIKDEEVLKSLPLPTLIDLHLRKSDTVSPETLLQKLKPLADGIEVDGPGAWLASFLKAVKGLGSVAWILVLLTLGTLVVSIGLICRVAFALQDRTLDLLHLLGATDASIAQSFQRQIFRLSLPAALFGALLAAGSLVGLAELFRNLASAPLSFTGVWGIAGGVLFMVPVLAVAVATTASRAFVLLFLRRRL